MFWLLDDDTAQTIRRPREMTPHLITLDDIPSHINDRKKTDIEACRMQVKITGMSCASCVNKIESSLSSKKG